MKYILSIAFLLSVMLLCSCEERLEESWVEGKDIIVTQSLSGMTDASNIVLSTQYPVYGNDCEYIVVIVENSTDENVMLGLYCMLEKKVGDEWMFVRHASGGTDDVGFYCEPDNSFSTICYLSSLDYDLEDGEYRIVKQVDGFWYAAEFTVGDSEITSETPHGFAPLEKLPADYTLDDAASDGCVCVTAGGDVINGEKLDEFFEYAEQDFWRGQLRIAYTTIEGDLILTDVIREERDRIDIVRDTTRDAYDIGKIQTSYYRYFRLDGSSVYLTNFYELSGDPEPFYLISLPEGSSAPELIRSYYTHPTTTYFAIYSWSPGADIRVCWQDNEYMSDPNHLNISTDGWSRSYKLKNELPADSKIIDIRWQDEATCMVAARLPDDSYYYEFISVSSDDSKKFECLSYTYSRYKYQIRDDMIIIPE